MVVEILILLSCTWSIFMRKFVEYEEMQKDQAPLAIVIPERGKPEIVALDPEDKSFRFQNLRFVLMRDKTSYEAQPALDNLLLSTYLETKGHKSDKSMMQALRTFGTNELNIPTPEFSELSRNKLQHHSLSLSIYSRIVVYGRVLAIQCLDTLHARDF